MKQNKIYKSEEIVQEQQGTIYQQSALDIMHQHNKQDTIQDNQIKDIQQLKQQGNIGCSDLLDDDYLGDYFEQLSCMDKELEPQSQISQMISIFEFSQEDIPFKNQNKISEFFFNDKEE